MKVTPLSQEGLSHTFEVVVAAADVNTLLEQQLQSIGKKAKVPGFRPGKIPMDVLKQRYGKEVMDEVLWNAVSNATKDVLTDKDIRPAMKPDVDIKDYKEDGDLKFELSVDALPEVPELDYDKITVTRYEFDIPESEVTEGLSRLADSRKHFHEAKEGEKAKEGDAVKIDFVGKLKGEPFEGGKGEGFQLELGSGQFIPGFEEQLIGVKTGDETVVKVKFPEEYHSADLAGADAEFDVTVHAVLTPHTPEADDKLAEDVGFESLDKLKEAVSEQIKSDYEGISRNRAKKELFDWLDENVKFDVPPKMVKMEFEGIWQQLQEAKKRGDESVKDKSDDELRPQYEKICERRVRLGLVLADIGQKNNIQVGRDELSQAVMQQARQFPGQEQKVFEFYQKNPQHVDELKGPIIEDKAVDFVLEKVKRKDQKITLEELTKLEAEDEEKA